MAEHGKTSVEGKVVAITGAASGIGRALAHRFAQGGARLGLLDRDPTPFPTLVSELGDLGAESLPLACDVTRWEDSQTAIQSVLEHFGRIDILVNNAGITHLSRFANTDVSVVRKVMDVSFFGAVHCTKAALPALVESRGLVIVISSIAGFSPLAGRCGYSAAKHALHGFFESLRCEMQMSGVRVMVVCPGFTNTAIGRNALGGDGGAPRATRTTAGKAADPAQVANAIYRAALRGRRMLVLSPVGKLAFVVSRLFPAAYERMMTRSMLRDFD